MKPECSCGCPVDCHGETGCGCGCAWGRCYGWDLPHPKPPCRHDVSALLQKEYGLTPGEANVWLMTKIPVLDGRTPMSFIRNFEGEVVVDLIESTRSGFCA